MTDEVDKLLNIVQETLKRLLPNGKVSLRAHLGGKASAKGQLTDTLCKSSNCQI